MARLRSSVALCCLWLASPAACGSGNGAPLGPPDGTVPVGLQEVASGLAFPYLTAPPATPRLFIVEKGGTIRIVKNGALLPHPFSICGRSRPAASRDCWASPSIRSTPRTAASSSTTPTSRATPGSPCFRVSLDPNVADPASERPILAVDQPFTQPQRRPGALRSRRLSLRRPGRRRLGRRSRRARPIACRPARGPSSGSSRFEALATPSRRTIPSSARRTSAPRSGATGCAIRGALASIRATGDLYIADVGQRRGRRWTSPPPPRAPAAGSNFGWNRMEGGHCYAASSCDQSGLALPVLEYSHHGTAARSPADTSTGALPSRRCRGTISTPTSAQGWVRSFRLRGRPGAGAAVVADAGSRWTDPQLRAGRGG